MINLIVERGLEMTFDQLPPSSIALDGVVLGPAIDPTRRRYSFDHHGGCLRLATRSTCEQVMDALLLGLDPNGMNVYVNDVDHDTVLAVWLLQNPQRVQLEQVRLLVATIGGVDAHGLGYKPLDDRLFRAFSDGVMSPFNSLGRDGYQTADLRSLLSSCLALIDSLLNGTLASFVTVQCPYQVTHEGTGWVMARAEHNVCGTLYALGHDRVVLWSPLSIGGYRYTVAKRSDLVGRFPVGPATAAGSILESLSLREPGWGGSTAIGGSPRTGGSSLTPDEVFAIIEAVVAASA